jgi:hypothetical protein
VTVSLHARAAVAALAGVVTLAVASLAGPSTASLLAVLAATALLGVAVGVAVQHAVAAPMPRVAHVGARSRVHRESLDVIAAPTHPDTAGRVRSRAPGEVLSAA